MNCDLKIHGLEKELELMRKECTDLRTELQKAKQTVLRKRELTSNILFHVTWNLRLVNC